VVFQTPLLVATQSAQLGPMNIGGGDR